MLEGNHIQCPWCTAMLPASCRPRPGEESSTCALWASDLGPFQMSLHWGTQCVWETPTIALCVWMMRKRKAASKGDWQTHNKNDLPSTQHNMKLDNIDMVTVSICWVSLKCVCWCPKPQYLGVLLELETEERADIRRDSRGRLIQSDCCLHRTRLGCRYTQGWRYKGQCQRYSSRSKETLEGADDSSTLLANF